MPSAPIDTIPETAPRRGLARIVDTALHAVRSPRHAALLARTGGMLPLAVYRELTGLVRRGPAGLDIVEVGGASGTATIAMAWGLRDAGGSRPRVVVVEKCEGGTRTRYGGREANKARFERFVRRHGVGDRVVLHPHYLTIANGAEVRALVRTGRIAGLLCDADGMVHRDLHLFGDLIDPDGFVVIDDYHPMRSPKHAVTCAVVNRLVGAGAFRPVTRIRDTVIGKPGIGVSESLHRECESIVEEVCRRQGVILDARGLTRVGAGERGPAS